MIGVGWWLWMSMTGNFARGTGCSGHDERRVRLVVDDGRRRELRLAARRPAAAERALALLPGGACATAGGHGRAVTQHRDVKKPICGMTVD